MILAKRDKLIVIRYGRYLNRVTLSYCQKRLDGYFKLPSEFHSRGKKILKKAEKLLTVTLNNRDDNHMLLEDVFMPISCLRLKALGHWIAYTLLTLRKPLSLKEI